MILDIVTYPDPRLKQPCEPVTEVTDEIRKLAADMLEPMYAAPGVVVRPGIHRNDFTPRPLRKFFENHRRKIRRAHED